MSKACLDCWARPAGRAWRVDYTDTALTELTAELVPMQPARIIVEATGGLETRLAAELSAAGLPIVVVNPRRCVPGPTLSSESCSPWCPDAVS